MVSLSQMAQIKHAEIFEDVFPPTYFLIKLRDTHFIHVQFPIPSPVLSSAPDWRFGGRKHEPIENYQTFKFFNAPMPPFLLFFFFFLILLVQVQTQIKPESKHF